ncbi:MAG: hypothetical protein GX083_00380 [Clostridiales bacterium]|nr:hypothetical protein [Clostridiales bacterium]
MNRKNEKKHKKIIALMMTLCFAVGIGAIPIPVLAASEFTSNSPYGSTGRTTYMHKSKFSGYLMTNGVDISTYQSANTNWSTAKKENNVDFAILRVTYTGYGSSGSMWDDEKFERHYRKAKDAGVMVGAYVFSQATTVTEAKAEATKAVNRLKKLGIKPKDLDLPIYMDYEYAGPSSGSDKGRLYSIKNNKIQATKCAKAFCDTVKAEGYEVGIYANTSFFSSMIDENNIGSDVDLWCAQYYSKCTSTKTYSKWQFTSTALINGIYSSSTGKIGSTDGNFWYIKRNPKSNDQNDITNSEIYGVTDWNYSGKTVEPKFEVINKGKNLIQGKDYTIGYINNIKKGDQQAYAYIRGIGSYNGYALIPFTIGTGFISRIGLDNANYTNELGETQYIFGNVSPQQNQEEETAVAGDVTGLPVEETEEDLSELGETVSGKTGFDSGEGGTSAEVNTEVPGPTEEAPQKSEPLYLFEIGDSYVRNVPTGLTVREFLNNLGFIEGYENYSLSVIDARGAKLSDTKTVKTGMLLGVYKDKSLVGTADISVNGDWIKNRSGNDPRRSLITASTSETRYYYTGKVIKPLVTSYYEGLKISNDSVTIKYSSGSKNPGSYKVYVTGKTYPGYITSSYSIVVKPASIYRLSALNNGFKVQVYKSPSNYVSGYQLRYSTSSNMSSAKTKTIGTSYNKVSQSVKKLRDKKKYYVQVRSYKKIGKKKYYSSWSKVESVNTR